MVDKFNSSKKCSKSGVYKIVVSWDHLFWYHKAIFVCRLKNGITIFVLDQSKKWSPIAQLYTIFFLISSIVK